MPSQKAGATEQKDRRSRQNKEALGIDTVESP